MNLPLEEMTVPDKLRVMEALWDDLCRQPEEPTSPDWHEDVLAERQAKIDRGEARFTEWEVAKERIRNRVS